MLTDAALTILFINSDYVDPYQRYVEDALEEYELALAECKYPSEILEVIRLGADQHLPITLVVDTFEKYLEFDRENSYILRSYAEFIDLMIPDWREYADRLYREADKLDTN